MIAIGPTDRRYRSSADGEAVAGSVIGKPAAPEGGARLIIAKFGLSAPIL
jgi:hypothetical protein